MVDPTAAKPVWTLGNSLVVWLAVFFVCGSVWGSPAATRSMKAVSELDGSSPPQAVPPPPPSVSQPSMMALEIRAELFPDRHTTLSSEMSARIVKIAPREGRRFKKGQILVVFDCALEEAQRTKAKAVLNAARASAKVSRKLSKYNATSKLEEQLARAEAAKAKADLAIIQVKIGRCLIKAPYSGRVATLHAQPHQYVKAGEPLMEIHDLASPEVVFLLPSHRLRQVRVGDRFQVRIDETGRRYPARIVAFGALIDAVSQSVKTHGEIKGRFPELLPGMSGLVDLGTVDRPVP